MNKTLQIRIISVLAIAFTVFWALAIGLDYINKHPIYYYGFKHYKFLGLSIGLGITGLAFMMIEKSVIKLPFKIPVNGLWLLFYGAILSYFIVKANARNVPFVTERADYMHYVGLVLKSTVQLIIIYGILKSFGARITAYFYKKGLLPSGLLDTAFGIMVFVMLLFVVAAFGMFNTYSLLLILLILAVAHFRNLIPVFKKLLWTRIDFSSFNKMGVFSIYALFVFLLINYISIQNPFPNGFDARNYYGNICALLGQGGALVKGYAPYNWSIFMAVGNILFNQIELSLSISFSAFILVLLVSYKIAIDKLSFDKSQSAFIMLLVCITPALVNQLFVELKLISDYCLFRHLSCIIFLKYCQC